LRSSHAIAIALVAVVAGATGVSAHRLDELLQAARIDVKIDRVELELSLTPGAAVASRIIGAIDRDRDGIVSNEERRAFANDVIASVRLGADDRPLQAEVTSSTFAEVGALLSGDGTIELRAVAPLAQAPDGEHRISFANTYRRDISVYLANALVPDSDRIAITAQGRDGDQSELTIDYVVNAERAVSFWYWPLGIVGGVAVLARRRRHVSETI
jgi:hypothetical protein